MEYRNQSLMRDDIQNVTIYYEYKGINNTKIVFNLTLVSSGEPVTVRLASKELSSVCKARTEFGAIKFKGVDFNLLSDIYFSVARYTVYLM